MASYIGCTRTNCFSASSPDKPKAIVGTLMYKEVRT